jgi:trehalose 6-phosphate synthase/phosphatase
MPLEEQQERMMMMQKRLKEYDVVKWMTDFLDQLRAVKKEQDKLRMKLLDEKALQKLIDEYNAAEKRLMLLDYDGTLAPFSRIPSEATPSKYLIEQLEMMASDPKNEVVVISGRDEKTLHSWLGKLPISLVAEHGASIRFKGSEWRKQFNIQQGWKDRIRPIMELFTSRCAGSLVEEKENTLAWHYRNTISDLGFTRSRELINAISQLISNTSLQVIDGNKVVEVRQSGVDKGTTAMKLVNNFSPNFVFCIGDDATDEDMFNILRNKAFTIKIGNGATAAEYNILQQTEVLPLLSNLIDSANIKQRNAYS